MTPPPSTGRSRLVPVIAVLSSLLLIVSVIGIVMMALRLRDQRAHDEARAEAINAAEQFALRMDGLALGNLEAYKKSVEPLLTTKEKTVFEQQFKQFEAVYEQAKKAGAPSSKPGKGTIVLSGSSDVDTDSATVLVAHDSSVEGQAQALHFRWQLGMRKVEGAWLVDDFTPVE